MRRIARAVVRIAALAVFVLVALFAANSLVGEECGTELCCDDCEIVPVTRVIDGDTFVSADERVRLFGADTPERGERCFDEATERLRDLAGRAVRVEIGPRTRDRYGRRLRYVYTRAGDSVEELLVREGLALAWPQDGQHRDLLVSLEAEARRSGTGCLW